MLSRHTLGSEVQILLSYAEWVSGGARKGQLLRLSLGRHLRENICCRWLIMKTLDWIPQFNSYWSWWRRRLSRVLIASTRCGRRKVEGATEYNIAHLQSFLFWWLSAANITSSSSPPPTPSCFNFNHLRPRYCLAFTVSINLWVVVGGGAPVLTAILRALHSFQSDLGLLLQFFWA